MINFFFLSSPSVRRRPFEQNRIIEKREEKKKILEYLRKMKKVYKIGNISELKKKKKNLRIRLF